MRVLVLGAAGMLGHKLMQVLSARFEMVGTVRRGAASFADHPVRGGVRLIGGVQAEVDDGIIRAMAEVRPEVVINAIGLIKQLPGAKDPIASITINSLFPHRVAQLCGAAGARLFHISTDCVFSGRRGNYTEQDETDGLDLYGRSKLLGEVDRPGAVTLRTSIIGRELETTSGLIEWFISHRGREVKGFAGAIYAGLTTPVLARLIGELIESHSDLYGLWQVSSEPISKYNLLQMVNDAMGLGITIHRDERFVCDLSLNSERFRKATGFRPPSWQEMVAELAADPTPYDSIRGGS